MKKIVLVLLSVCCLCGSAFAQQNKEEMAQVYYCYGVYEAIKSPAEVQKIKNMLKSSGDEAYSNLTNNEFFRKGKSEAKTLSNKKQRECLFQTYGFLFVLEMALKQAPEKLNKDPLYCLGYVDAASNGESFLKDICSAFPSGKYQDVNACYRANKKKAMKNSPVFTAGYNSAAIADPVQVTVCMQTLMTQGDVKMEKIVEHLIEK